MNQQVSDLVIAFGIRWFIGWMLAGIEHSNLFINKPRLNAMLFLRVKPVPFYAVIWQVINYMFLIISLINLLVYFISYSKLLYIYVECSYYGMIATGILLIMDVLIYGYRH